MDVMEKSSNEKRLIDAYAFIEKMKRTSRYFDVKFDIDEMPTIDAVPVVRCRDCKHCDPENHHCDHPMSTSAPLIRKPDDFCSYGERKGGDDNG